MPDPQRKTVSATEVSALFNASPCETRWSLWQRFTNGASLPRVEDERMRWGKALQPLILEQAAHDLKLEVIPGQERYVTRGNVGCTRDATIICPDRGPGALEVKCVFDYRRWMQDWSGGESVPRHIEMQLQTQMFVGDSYEYSGCSVCDEPLEELEECPIFGCDGVAARLTTHRDPYSWGVIAVWVCADMYYFERKPMTDLWSRIDVEADKFMQSVRDGVEPDPFGSPIELPLLTQIYPTIEGSWIDLRGDTEESLKWAVKARTYTITKSTENASKKVCETLRAEMIAKLRGAEKCVLAGGGSFGLGKGNRLNVWLPGVDGDE